MSLVKTTYSLLLSFILLIGISAQDIRINEVMSKNETSLSDSEMAFPDWIELYNTTTQSISLKDWSMSDDSDDILKWTFPDVNIDAENYLIIFASGDDMNIQSLHTNFKLSSSGESVYLYNSNQELISQLNFPSLQVDQSFGYLDGENRLFDLATPGKSNAHTSNLTCDIISGFYPFPLEVSFTDNLSFGDYRYSLGGVDPGEDGSDFLGSVFLDNEILPNRLTHYVTSPEQELMSFKAWSLASPDIPKCHILKYAAYANGSAVSDIESRTFFSNNGVEDIKLPVISIIAYEEDLFNDTLGIYVPGVNLDVDDPEWTGNYFQKGRDWERKVKFEYFDENKNLIISQDAGIRIHGGKTRGAAQKSLRVYARDVYGKDSFEANIFDGFNVQKFDNFILRTSMASWRSDLMFKDALIHSLVSDMDVDHQKQRPVLVYLNGEFWGIHFIIERIDDNYIANNHEIPVDSVEIFDWTNPTFFGLMNFVNENDLSVLSNYEELASVLDIPSFIDYVLTEVYFGNRDWPFNNFTAWRHKKVDGKWRFILFDTDGAFFEPEDNNLDHLALNSGPSWEYDPFVSLIFIALAENESFVDAFINRYAFLIKNNFSPDIVINKIREFEKLLSYNLEDHMLRWNFPDSKSQWLSDINNDLIDFAIERPCLMKHHLEEVFDRDILNFSCE